MIPRSRERRHGDRRAHARGGRRATDGLAVSAAATECPSCGGAANEVGESDGGWWFVCANCDLLWNQRERNVRADSTPTPVIDAVPSPSVPPTSARR